MGRGVIPSPFLFTFDKKRQNFFKFLKIFINIFMRYARDFGRIALLLPICVESVYKKFGQGNPLKGLYTQFTPPLFLPLLMNKLICIIFGSNQ